MRNIKHILFLLLIAITVNLACLTPVESADTLFTKPVLLKLDTSALDSLQTEKPDQTVPIVSALEKTMQNLGVKSLTDKAIPKAGNTFRLSFGKIFTSIILLLIVGIFIRFLSGILNTISERRDNWRLILKRIIPIFRIGTWTFAIYFVIQVVIAPPIETLFAVITSAGVAIGFASQDILKNIFGGIMILFDRPFQVGDKIEVSGYYGEVINIGLRSVRIVTPDDSVVTVPNSEITNKMVSNANFGENNCQVVSEIYLPADADLEAASKIGYTAAAISRFVYLKKPITVIFVNEMFHDKSMIRMKVKAYVYDIRAEFKFKSDVTKCCVRELLKAGIMTKEELS
jgi:small-conductance mechanosensitive channel